MRTASVLISILLIAGLTSCNDDAIYQDTKEVPDGVWAAEEAFDFEFDIEDKDARYDFFVDLRNTGDYPYSNIYLFIELNFPNGKQSRDTVECFLADPTGKWYGSGLGDIYDNRILFKHDVSFPLNGSYKLSIQQAMREDRLEGILDVGFRLAPAYRQ